MMTEPSPELLAERKPPLNSGQVLWKREAENKSEDATISV